MTATGYSNRSHRGHSAGWAGSGGIAGLGRFARLLGAVACCLALANCANSNLSSKVDPKYGVASSTRVVEPGEPVPKGGGVYRVGKPYMVGGREYVPQEDVNYSAVGLASWYGDDFHGRFTANGEVFDMNSISAAHPTLPLPSYVRVTNLANHRSIVVRVNDRGPYVGNRVIDLSVKTAKLLGFYGHGLAKVKVEYVGRAPLARLRRPQADGDLARRRAGARRCRAGGIQPGVRAGLFRCPADIAPVPSRAEPRPSGPTGSRKAPARCLR